MTEMNAPLVSLPEILAWIDDNKGEQVVEIPLDPALALGAYMVIASGLSVRHVVSMSEDIIERLKAQYTPPLVSGLEDGDWVVIDAIEIIVHIFRPEVREFYRLEKLWQR